MGNERCHAPLVTTPTRELAAFLTDLNGRVDARLLRLANDYLLDTIGCMIYGSTKPWAQMATAHALRTGGTGSSGVIASDCTTTPAMAAFANGAAAHAFELDDVHEEAISHPGAVVIPAVLAVADEIDASGRDIHEAIVVGYEAMGRAGIAVGPASHMLSGFHPTSMSGTFGSAAAVGRLLDFDATTMNHAIGIAASMASGTMEFASSGGMTKRIHAARAAEGGVTAALLAAEGFEGSNDGLAGKYGFCRIFTNNPQLHLLTRDLGNRWMTDEITIKPYAACSDIHPMIQATVELRAEHGFESSDIERIVAVGPTKAATQNDMDGTVSVLAAQYSAQWNIAAAILADPTDPATYAEDRIARADMAALQATITSVEASADADRTYAWKMAGGVTITLTDGTELTRWIAGQKGSMHDPLTSDEIESKFRHLVGDAATEQIAAIRSML